MDIQRFLHSFAHHRFRPRGAPREITCSEVSQRPGMHQQIEDLDASFFTQADLDLLDQMGICGTRVAGDHEVDDPKIYRREGVVVEAGPSQPGFPEVKLPI